MGINLVTCLDLKFYTRTNTDFLKIVGNLGGLLRGLSFIGFIVIGWYQNLHARAFFTSIVFNQHKSSLGFVKRMTTLNYKQKIAS